MILMRLTEDNRWLNLKEGSCITEEQFKLVYYSDKCLFEAISEIDRKEMIEYENEAYCLNHNIECMLFYTKNELDKFLKEND